jgi:putative transposase
MIVKPETLIGWHRKGFKMFWRWKSRLGRPRIPENLRQLIVRLVLENPAWGEERIGSRTVGEARDLGFAPNGAGVLAAGY